MEYKSFTDSGHGWVEVPYLELEQLGIIDEITSYSYMNFYMAYLEEDLDWSTWINKRRELNIPEPIISDTYIDGECFVRDYQDYLPRKIKEDLRVIHGGCQS